MDRAHIKVHTNLQLLYSVIPNTHLLFFKFMFGFGDNVIDSILMLLEEQDLTYCVICSSLLT